MRRRRSWDEVKELDYRALSDGQRARVWGATLCFKFARGKCRKGAKCIYLHAVGRDPTNGSLGRVYTTEVMEEGENHEISTRVRASNLMPLMRRFIADHRGDVRDILAGQEHQGESIKFYLDAPLHAGEMILSCNWECHLGQDTHRGGTDYIDIMHGMLHGTSVHAAMSILLIGHLLARKPRGTESDTTPVGCYFAPAEEWNKGYNLGAMFEASLFGIKRRDKKGLFGQVVPTGIIALLTHRAAKDHATDQWSHQLSSVTFDRKLLEAFLQRWVDDGYPTNRQWDATYQRENERGMSHRRLTYACTNNQDVEKRDATLVRLDERQQLLSSRVSQNL